MKPKWHRWRLDFDNCGDDYLSDCKACGAESDDENIVAKCPCWKMRLPKRKEK